MIGADAFLAARYPQQIFVNRAVPMPVETAAIEGFVEGLPMQLLSFGQGAVDIEDQRGSAPDQLWGARWRNGGRFCPHDRRLPEPRNERPSPGVAGE